MTLSKTFTRAAVFAAMTVGLSNPASAAFDFCSEKKLYTTDAGRQVTFVDVGAQGPSIGDQRIGQKDLLDSAGEKVGVFRWVATIVQMGEGDDKPIYRVKKSYELEDGILFGTAIDNVKSPVGDTSMVSIVSGQTSILGGVGKFANVTGTKRHERHPETGRFTYHFDIECE